MLNSILSLAPESPLEHAVLRNQRRRSMADLSSSVFARLRECVCLAAAMECECVCSCGSGVSGIRTTREGLVVRYAIANDETGQRPWQGGHMQPRQAGIVIGIRGVWAVIKLGSSNKMGRPSPSNFRCSQKAKLGLRRDDGPDRAVCFRKSDFLSMRFSTNAVPASWSSLSLPPSRPLSLSFPARPREDTIPVASYCSQ